MAFAIKRRAEGASRWVYVTEYSLGITTFLSVSAHSSMAKPFRLEHNADRAARFIQMVFGGQHRVVRLVPRKGKR